MSKSHQESFNQITIVIAIALAAILFVTIADGSNITKLNASSNSDCDASYPDVCIASPPPDLNCDDIADKDFKVEPEDPHGFDRDGNGIGCES